MTDPLLFAVGLVITVITVTAVVLIGRSEAQDPDHNRTGQTSDSKQ
ncbi:MAG: hypothetical protein SGJ09_04185 [Phycisphaerae bacterium]|nr:hypothetical protein [Phycisphaerae bacterium]